MKILVIRRDNIGDLVCTTPLLAALRQRFPDAWIGVLANSYNAPVLAGNPDIDEVFVYCKIKHRPPGESVLSMILQRLRMLWRLRRMRIDDVILAAPSYQASAQRFAHWIKPRRILGGFDSDAVHEVEKVCAVLSAYGITDTPPPCKIIAPATQASAAQHHPLIGIHISARKPSQRWPTDSFVALIKALHQRHDAAFLLFWSPGSSSNPLHPGDDEKAQAILSRCADLPLRAYPTATLEQLIAGLASTDQVICSDGGAMHIAAGLGKPIVCLFGDSGLARWCPWGVPHRALQADSRNVRDIDVTQVRDAYAALYEMLEKKS